MTTSTIFLLLVAAASTIAFTPPEVSYVRVRRSPGGAYSGSSSTSSSSSHSSAGAGGVGTGHHAPAAKSYKAATGYQGAGVGYQATGAGYQGGSTGYQGGSTGYQGGSTGYQGYQGGAGGYQGGGGGYQGGSGGYQGAGAGYQGGGGGGFGGGFGGGQYPYYPTVHTTPVAQPFDFASLFRYLQQLQAIVQQQQRQHQLAFSGYAPGEATRSRPHGFYSWHAATAGDPWRRTPSFAHSNAMFFNKGFGGYSDLDSNTLGERFGAASGGGAAGGAYSGSFSGSGSGTGAGGFGAVPGFGAGGFGGGNAGGQPFVFGSSGPAGFGGQGFGGQAGFGGGYQGFGGGAGGGGGGDGAVGAAASAAIGPQGGFQMASLFPDTGLSSRFGGDVSPPAGNSFGVFTSSSSGSSDINGKKTSFKTATVGVNDNGKVTYKTVSDP